MKCFLLGHKGFLGGHLLPKLQTLGHDVITDLRYWDERYELVINLAAKTHLRTEFDPQLIESNYILADKVFKRSERILYASSCSAKYNTNPYAASKIWAEYLGEKHGNAVGFRFYNIYGTGNNKGIVWYLMQQPDGAKITIRGEQLVRDYILVQDVVGEVIKHVEQETWGSEIIDVGTGVGTETIDLVNLYQRLSGKKFDISIQEAGSNEPLSMISNNVIPNAIDLETGLLKMINKIKYNQCQRRYL